MAREPRPTGGNNLALPTTQKASPVNAMLTIVRAFPCANFHFSLSVSSGIVNSFVYPFMVCSRSSISLGFIAAPPGNTASINIKCFRHLLFIDILILRRSARAG